MAAAVIGGALTWGVIWATSNAILHRSLEGAAKRWWTIFVDLATGILMLISPSRRRKAWRGLKPQVLALPASFVFPGA